jgi:AcrR family transcriptional regulator
VSGRDTSDELRAAAEELRREGRAAADEVRRESRAAADEFRLELGLAGRETRAALREALAEVRAAMTEVWGSPSDEAREPTSAGRLSRAERKEMTRELLLDAAVEVFARKGYHGASLDDVAEVAGFTKGAVYSNFTRKSDLFQALLEREKGRRDATMRAAVAAIPLEFLPTFAGEWFEHHSRELRDWDVLDVEFWLAAVRDPRIARDLAGGWHEARTELGASIERKLREAGVETGLSGHELAVILDALGSGLLMDQYLDPEQPRSEIFARAVRKLLADVGAVEPAQRGPEAAGE